MMMGLSTLILMFVCYITLMNVLLAHLFIYDRVVRAVLANWKEAIEEREVCTLIDNCYVNAIINGDKVEHCRK